MSATSHKPPLADLAGSATLRGRYGEEIDGAGAERLGRALGTLARRREARGPLLVGRNGESVRPELRDAVVRGLVLSGHDVVDGGVLSAEVFAFALKEARAAGGVLLQAESEDADLQILIFFLDKGPLVGASLAALAALADEGDFAAGEGTLSLRSFEDDWRRARAPASGGAGSVDEEEA